MADWLERNIKQQIPTYRYLICKESQHQNQILFNSTVEMVHCGCFSSQKSLGSFHMKHFGSNKKIKT